MKKASVNKKSSLLTDIGVENLHVFHYNSNYEHLAKHRKTKRIRNYLKKRHVIVLVQCKPEEMSDTFLKIRNLKEYRINNVK